MTCAPITAVGVALPGGYRAAVQQREDKDEHQGHVGGYCTAPATVDVLGVRLQPHDRPVPALLFVMYIPGMCPLPHGAVRPRGCPMRHTSAPRRCMRRSNPVVPPLPSCFVALPVAFGHTQC